MDSEIIIAMASVAGTIIGSFGGIITSSKLTSFRLDKLEQKVDQHNRFAEQMPVIEERIKELTHRLDEVERSIDNEN
ncbi:MAG: hypothetical protein NC397_09645 [Clostridium sp.]|nr:hypothetical protein [Clostridium sp.]